MSAHKLLIFPSAEPDTLTDELCSILHGSVDRVFEIKRQILPWNDASRRNGAVKVTLRVFSPDLVFLLLEEGMWPAAHAVMREIREAGKPFVVMLCHEPVESMIGHLDEASDFLMLPLRRFDVQARVSRLLSKECEEVSVQRFRN